MNILYLHAHDAGRYLQPYGAASACPNLQRLAEQSVVFRNAHAAAPTCSPSRAALLTGRSPHATGMLGLAHRGFCLQHPEQHLAAYLGGQGWRTALAGIQHLHCGGAPGRPYGVELKPAKPLSADNPVDWKRHDESVADRACEFLADKPVPGQEASRPFFLDCGFWYPHRPFPELDEADRPADFVEPPPGSVDSPETRLDTARFLAAVRHMDKCAGRVLDALDASGHADETLVMFTADHGIAFPGHKCQLTDRGTGVALMFRLPVAMRRQSGAGGVRDQLVSHLDVFPTLCDLAELDHPDWLEGVSLAPVLLGDKGSAVRSEIFSEVTWHAAFEPQRSVRTLTHRLIKRFGDEATRPMPANVDNSPAKSARLNAGWLEKQRLTVELYDLRLDPEEAENRADDPALAEVRADLEQRLADWMRRTDDPLLRGTPQPPAGAVIDASDRISAS